MPGQPESARCPQSRRAGFAGLRKEGGGSSLGSFLFGLGLRGREFGLALFGVQPGLCAATLLTEPAPLLRWRDQDRGVQPLPLGHSANPRRPTEGPALFGPANQSCSAGPAIRRASSEPPAVTPGPGPTVMGTSMPSSAGSGSAVASR